jgi:hypothetical protein
LKEIVISDSIQGTFDTFTGLGFGDLSTHDIQRSLD